MKRYILLTIIVLLFVFCPERTVGESPRSGDSAGRTELELTIIRYFEGLGSYQAGDLITQSQVEELQAYLRITNRRSVASHPKLLSQILPDDCRLSKLFYSKNGAAVIRFAVKKLGGYAELEFLTKGLKNYTLLVNAVQSNDADALVKLALERRAQAQGSETIDKRRRRKLPLYTVEQLLAEISARSSAKAKAQKSQEKPRQ